jgi:hypothetical protein
MTDDTRKPEQGTNQTRGGGAKNAIEGTQNIPDADKGAPRKAKARVDADKQTRKAAEPGPEQDLSGVRDQGAAAKKAKLPASHNPYPQGGAEAKAWADAHGGD